MPRLDPGGEVSGSRAQLRRRPGHPGRPRPRRSSPVIAAASGPPIRKVLHPGRMKLRCRPPQDRPAAPRPRPRRMPAAVSSLAHVSYAGRRGERVRLARILHGDADRLVRESAGLQGVGSHSRPRCASRTFRRRVSWLIPRTWRPGGIVLGLARAPRRTAGCHDCGDAFPGSQGNLTPPRADLARFRVLLARPGSRPGIYLRTAPFASRRQSAGALPRSGSRAADDVRIGPINRSIRRRLNRRLGWFTVGVGQATMNMTTPILPRSPRGEPSARSALPVFLLLEGTSPWDRPSSIRTNSGGSPRSFASSTTT